MERLSLKLLQDLSRLVEDFCKDCLLRGMTNESIRRYGSGLLIFAKFLLNKGVDQGSADAHVLKGFLKHILNFKKRYLRRYKNRYNDPERKLLSLEEISRFIGSIMDP